jgi:four helix bundle protein
VKVNRFEDIIAWQKGKELSVSIYKIFSKSKDYGFRDQILRASVSVMNNIAEGIERKSNSEFKQFLFIAKGSCGEIRSMLYLALELQTLSKQEFTDLINLSEDISRLLSDFIKTL